MRPKSALYYIEDLENIALDVTELIERESEPSGSLGGYKVLGSYAENQCLSVPGGILMLYFIICIWMLYLALFYCNNLLMMEGQS